VQQGNIITPEMVAQLKVGMSQDEVQYILGAPVLQPTFDNPQWDYIYTYKAKNSRTVEEKRLSVYFNSAGKVSQIQNQLTARKLQ
jgi:outer membrane protein assembly factor BamE